MPALLITIDTEPDLPKRRTPSPGTLHNVPALLSLQERIPDVKLTLLVTHSVVTDTRSLRVLDRLKRNYDCEIGAHLHPEETPPFARGFPDDTSLMRLPFEARAEKLRTLTRVISERFGAPVSYRAGRWKLSHEDLGLLAELGYLVDSTVTPYVSWRIEHGPDFTAEPRGTHAAPGMPLWETPITFDCTAEMRQAAPAAVHVDGTARPQLVERDISPRIHTLLTEYQYLTGRSSLINTSFNMHEEPIVATADDATRTFVQGGLDYLALGDFLVRAPA